MYYEKKVKSFWKAFERDEEKIFTLNFHILSLCIMQLLNLNTQGLRIKSEIEEMIMDNQKDCANSSNTLSHCINKRYDAILSQLKGISASIEEAILQTKSDVYFNLFDLDVNIFIFIGDISKKQLYITSGFDADGINAVNSFVELIPNKLKDKYEIIKHYEIVFDPNKTIDFSENIRNIECNY